MDIYDAIMKAAEHIERHPEEFQYGRTTIPKGCGSPACAVGWIGHFAGQPALSGLSETCRVVLGLKPSAEGVHTEYWTFEGLACAIDHRWAHSPRSAAAMLRVYAAKYHAPAKVVQPPDWNAIASRQTVGEHERSQELA